MEAGYRILGIDPGSRVTGYGLIEYRDKKWRCVESGAWTLNAPTFIQRLAILQTQIKELLEQSRPNCLAIEDVFVHKNPRGAIKLGQARGIVLGQALDYGLPVFEYAPKQVKQAVVGKGGAAKEQVQAMVKILLNLNAELSLDASDALAIALTHGHVNTGLAAVIQSNQFARRGRNKRTESWLNYDRKTSRKTD